VSYQKPYDSDENEKKRRTVSVEKNLEMWDLKESLDDLLVEQGRRRPRATHRHISLFSVFVFVARDGEFAVKESLL
jgi:hypothetical protein